MMIEPIQNQPDSIFKENRPLYIGLSASPGFESGERPAEAGRRAPDKKPELDPAERQSRLTTNVEALMGQIKQIDKTNASEEFKKNLDGILAGLTGIHEAIVAVSISPEGIAKFEAEFDTALRTFETVTSKEHAREDDEALRAVFKKKMDAFNRKLALLKKVFEELKDPGVTEAVFGRGKAKYSKLVRGLEKDFMDLGFTAHTREELAQLDKAFGQLTSSQETEGFLPSFWAEVGRTFTTKEGLKSFFSFLGNYTVGVGKGALSMIDPRTYITLAKMLGAATVSVMFEEDSLGKLHAKIKEVGDIWTNADEDHKAEMLGEFMGTIVGAKGLGVAVKAGKATNVAKRVASSAEGTRVVKAAKSLAARASESTRLSPATREAIAVLGVGIAPKIAPEAVEAIQEVAGVAKRVVKEAGHAAKHGTKEALEVKKVASHHSEGEGDGAEEPGGDNG